MTGRSTLSALQQLHRLARQAQASQLSDWECLERFRTRRDEDAFAMLVKRHGPMVRGVCRRVLRHAEDAEDVFQATFLVLARKAGSIRWKHSIAPWLYQVAYRLAHKGRVQSARRREQQATVEPTTPTVDESWLEVCGALDEELHGLAEKYRAPLVLCYLEGQTRDEAAERLGWSLGTLKRRLQKGRDLLRLRMMRRGVTLPAVLLSASLSGNEVEAALSTLTVRSLAQAATALASGGAISGPHLPAIALAEEALRMMSLSAVKLTAVLLLTLSLAGGAGLWACRMLATETPQAQPASPPETARDRGEWQAAKDERPRTDRFGDPLPPGAVARCGTIRLRHPQWVNSVRFTPDGKFLASAGWEGTIRLWEPATGKELRRFEGDDRGFFGIAFSPDGKILASAGNRGMIHAWDVPSRKYRFSVKGHEGSMVACVAISSDGKWLASGGGGNRSRTLVLWDLATGKEVRRLGGNMRTVKSVAFSIDGKFLAAASDVRPTHGDPADREGPGVVRLWDVTTGKLRWEKEEETGGATSVACAPDGKTVASAGYDAVIHIRDLATGNQVRKIQVPEDLYPVEYPMGRKGYNWGGVLALAYSRDSKLLASAGYDGTVRLWDTMTGHQAHIFRGHSREVMGVTFSPDSKTLASCSRDHTIRLWDPVNGKLLSAPVGHDGEVAHVAVFPDGQRAASAGQDRTIRLWDLATGRELVVLCGHTKTILSLAISPDGKTLATGSEDKTIRLWDAAAGGERGRILGPSAGASSLSFSPDGKLLAWADSKRSISADGMVSGPPIVLSELATGREVRRMEGEGQYFGVRFSPSGKWLAAYAFGHGVDFWEVTTGKRRHVFGDLIDFAFVPNTETVVGCCKDGMVRFRNLVDGRESRSFRGPSRPNWVQRPFAISPDGRTLLFGTEGNIQLWETASGRVRRTLSGHTSLISDGAFAPDGRTLLSGSWDTTLLVWDVARQTEEHQGKLGQTDLQALWQDLAGTDAVQADQAIWALAAGAEQAVPFLRKHLRPAPAVEPSRLSHLLADLDSDQFAVRDKATRELEALGELAEAAIRKLLSGKPSLEARRRGEQLLEKLRGPLPAGERLRSLRATEVLEHAGTEQARRLLARLADGAMEARLTREAKGALQRLDQQADVRVK